MDKFEETSLLKFQQHVIASPQIVKFALERRQVMAQYHGKGKAGGNAPETTKLVQTKIDTQKDAVYFYFLTESTEKYPKDHEFQDVLPNAGGAMQPNPSHLYEITLVFEELSKISNDPQVNLKMVKEWLWQTNFKIWSNSPSFYWQGFAFNLTQINSSLYPVNIRPKHWDKVHGDTLVDKHLFDLFGFIGFYINIMSGSLLNKLRGGKRPSRAKPKPQPTPVLDTKPIEPVQPEVDKTNTPAMTQEVPVQPSSTSTSAPQQPSTLSSTVAPTATPEDNIDLENPEQPKQEGFTMLKTNDTLKWMREGEGLRAKGYGLDLIFVENTDYLQDSLMEYNVLTKDFTYRFREDIPWTARNSAYKKIGEKNLKEVTVEFIKLPNNLGSQQMQEIFRSIHRYIFNEATNIDIMHFNFQRTAFASTFAEMISNLSAPVGFSTLVLERTDRDFSKVFLVREAGFKSSLPTLFREEEPPKGGGKKPDPITPDDVGGEGEMKGGPEMGGGSPPPEGGEGMSPPAGDKPPMGGAGPQKPEDPDAIPELEGRTAVITFQNMNPPVEKDHGVWLKRLAKKAHSLKDKIKDGYPATPILFVAKNRGESPDDLNLRIGIIKDMMKNGELDFAVRPALDLGDAMRQLSSKGYENVIVISSSKKVDQDTELVNAEKDGFTFVKVLSQGENPDSSMTGVKTRNALVDGDFDTFVKGMNIPSHSYKAVKGLYNLLRGELIDASGLGGR